MSEPATLTGTVAKIVSDREVILNRGYAQGLNPGDYLVVTDPGTQSIVDPETGKELGDFKRVKAVLRISECTENLSLAKTFRTKRVRVGGGMGIGGMGDMFAAAKYETKVETLRFDPKEGAPISEEESVISVGDPFEVISEEDAEDTKTVTLWS